MSLTNKEEYIHYLVHLTHIIRNLLCKIKDPARNFYLEQLVFWRNKVDNYAQRPILDINLLDVAKAALDEIFSAARCIYETNINLNRLTSNIFA